MDAFQSRHQALGSLPGPISWRSERGCGQLSGSGLIFSGTHDTSLSVTGAEAYLVQRPFQDWELPEHQEKKPLMPPPPRGLP